MLTSLALIFLVGLPPAAICQRAICGGLRLPRIIGMLFTGIILGPHVLGLLDDKILSISSELRQMALIIILLKKYRMWAIMSAKYAVSGRRFHQGRFISLS